MKQCIIFADVPAVPDTTLLVPQNSSVKLEEEFF